MIIDTHLHLIYLDKLSYPWLDNVVALRKNATFDQYTTIANRVGITGAMHMEVAVAESDIEAETLMVSDLMSSDDCLLKGAISACRPESNGFSEFLERSLENKSIKGFRRVLHVMPDELSTTKVFRENIRQLSGTGLTFDMVFKAAQLPLAIELVDHCPDVTFVLDHCGVPDINENSLEPWLSHMKELSKRDNVYAKISGIVAYGDHDTWSLSDIRPYFEQTIDAFGWSRVVWGSDSPVCTLAGQIETWVAATHALLDSCSKDEKAALLHDNAASLWSLPISRHQS